MKLITPVTKLYNNVFFKLEYLNVGGSHKSRAARRMISDAVDSGKIIPGRTTIIEKTGGNLGIGLAVEANKRGIDLDLAVGLSFSPFKRRLLEYYGANMIGIDMMKGGLLPRQVIEFHMTHQEDFGKEYFFIDQFSNKANVRVHFEETGPELAEFIVKNKLTNKKIILLGGIGSGASLCGTGSYLKSCFRDVSIVGVQPEGCSIVDEIFTDHPIQGLAVGVKPKIFDEAVIDQYLSIKPEKAEQGQNILLNQLGIYGGISTGANIGAIEELIKEVNQDSVIFSFVYDSGDSYINLENVA
ncbi:PLP-dependent cysteine synthase family protein [Endozoicomonas acroporae]|uniref:PLP-dependent cysteine synthase family protein n=1 Tax=Endozoicomonas acroporae TaxID=1701104 RepID=UPI0013D4CBEE|nr:pyridoxal-phosphate dependent enzyme [Endozoicomonas acroporae]